MTQYDSDQRLTVDGTALEDVAREFGTPCYVYSAKTLRENWARFESAFQRQNHLICYAVKANANPALLRSLKELGAGFDIVSAGELDMVLSVGADPRTIVFSGVGKTRQEIVHALNHNIGHFNVESVAELERINELAGAQNTIANVAIRANPDIDAGTHPYIATGLEQNKFGIPIAEVPKLEKTIKRLTNISLMGLACHIGSQIEKCEPFAEAALSLEQLRQTMTELGFEITSMDLGGGLAATADAPTINEWIDALETTIPPDVTLKIEPGRSMVGNTGVLLTRVEYLKQSDAKNFAIVDAGMNDFLRPALYQGWHDILNCRLRDQEQPLTWDVVGPVCESGDFLGKERQLAIHQDDLLAVTCAGAYGYVMTSTYNGRPRPAEVLIDDGRATLIRQRQKDLAEPIT
ncbi:MAG: diaminopimelate decarboxylase [Pseudomonadota bacterium]